MNRSLFTPLPVPLFGFSVHISFTFSKTILKCRSKALTRAKSLRLLRQEIRTWEWFRVAVRRRDSGPAVSSCSSTRATSYSLLHDDQTYAAGRTWWDARNVKELEGKT